MTPSRSAMRPSSAAVHTRRKSLMLCAAGTFAALPLAWLAAAQAQGRLRPTPAQTEGPFYPVRMPDDADHDLLANGTQVYTPREAAWVSGVVMDLGGRPVRGAVVEIWQCDEQGHYHHPGDGGRADPAFQGFGRVAVDAAGRYRFRTLRPAAYAGRTPHIHVKVKQGGQELLTTQLYVEGDPGNARDGLWRRLRDPQDRAALTVPFRPVPGAGGELAAEFPIVVG